MKSNHRNKRWCIEEAVDFIRCLQNFMSPNYYVGMWGSVLMMGLSNNDLDILIIPHSTDKNDPERIDKYLQEAGLRKCVSNALVKKKWARIGSTDTKFVEVWRTEDRKRVDIFQPYYHE